MFFRIRKISLWMAPYQIWYPPPHKYQDEIIEKELWKWKTVRLENGCSSAWILEWIYLYMKFKMVPGVSHQEPFCLQSKQW